MGGQSTGQVRPADTSGIVFHGVVSLANGGGFASVKADISPLNLNEYVGLRLPLCGDGRGYKLGLRHSHERSAPVYQYYFDTEAGTWVTVALPFCDFLPTWRGRTLHDAPPLDPSRIASLSLFISGKQAGPFELRLRAIKLDRHDNPAPG